MAVHFYGEIMALNSTNIDPKVIELDGKTIAPLESQLNGDAASFVLDKDWMKQAFLLKDNDLNDDSDVYNRYWSSAEGKFTDTRIGGNIGINSRPQFTRYCDIRVKGRMPGRSNVNLNETSGNYGMGRYYSEAIDDNAQRIYLRFGVPQYNSLSNFLAKAFDPEQISLARTGRGSSIFYTIAKGAGTIASVKLFTPVAITMLAGKALGYFFRRPTSKFYTLKPTMLMYWSTVDNLLNSLAIKLGILPIMPKDDDTQNIRNPYKLDEDQLNYLSKMLPDMFKYANYFDTYSIANKAQRTANILNEKDYQNLSNGTASNFLGYVKRDSTGGGTHATPVSNPDGTPTFFAALDSMLKLGDYDYYIREGDDPNRLEVDPRINMDDPQQKQREDEGYFENFKKSLDAEFRDGSAYAVFTVDYTGSVSESFGNSVVESDLSQKLNESSSSIRESRFSFAEGNIAGDNPLMDIVQNAISGAADVATGLISGITFGFSDFMMGLAGSGYLDIPKHWQSSSANLPRSNYTIRLVSPYGNAFSKIQNIYLPLCMLLAGALPLSTGKQSYTSPFICQLYDLGRIQIRLGMIESLSITRGTRNLAFDRKGHPLGIDVSFSIVDLSSIMHMPVSNGIFGGSDMTLDEDNILSDYLSVLAGQDMYSQIYPWSKAKLALAKTITKTQAMTSSARMAMVVHDSATSGMLQYLTLGVGNVVEAVARGSNVITQNN